MKRWRRVRHPTTLVPHILVSGRLTTPCGIAVTDDWQVTSLKFLACKFCEKALAAFRKRGYWAHPQDRK